ncbi:hypothetical protein LTR56_016399 [Elasticomyces elasticus]|nr:hypothetical protein LTR56_016399 [Elasticomyces elasticus]KAK3636276.1 hypothetical protein LTR22_018796 [Elasticomyces elasticus]KAK4912057.1 hypothetical protein LTR49_019433 [Elasticomyces elasticus]KAK5751746.1 hypothetical protein LTS12_018160 [Elasticomyces elasticus]
MAWYRCRYNDIGTDLEYWKFDDHSHKSTADAKWELIDRGFFTKKSIVRADRGYLSYEKYEEAELRHFCGSRSLELAAESTVSKADLVAALEEADDTWTFPLMDLPPELRLEIYAHHFAAFDLETNITPPPVTTACRQVRTEALPLFYDTQSFIFRAARYLGDAHFTFDRGTSNITRRLLDSNFLLIRKIQLGLTVGTAYESESIDCKIDLGGKHAAASIRKCRSMISDHDRRHQEEISTMMRVETILSSMSARTGGKALRRGDIRVLIQALYPGNLKVVTNIEEEDA